MDGMKKLVQVIDLTPTWPEALNIYLQALESGTPTVKKEAKEGLLRMAEVAQMYVDETKEERTKMKRFKTAAVPNPNKQVTVAALLKDLQDVNPSAIVRFAIQDRNKVWPSYHLTVEDTFGKHQYQFWIKKSNSDVTIRLHLPDKVGFVDRRPKEEKK